ncbi:ribonuclease III [Magnetofaba australis]|uniref:Ribonuclease 3 n=1 Tax=Magnetofaba australis IT-1 TaxID=1434232 RepID=A0A1Y2K4Q9_9PROT|nr:ribonuclease III [Magnetofaba australis]OSM04305.1 putative ribonuclease III [Magnetofaba australis IT-1]
MTAQRPAHGHLPEEGRIQERLGYAFRDLKLLKLALTHRSWPPPEPKPGSEPEANPHNERLEFLGDSVLSLIISQALYDRFADAPEGTLSQVRAALVNTKSLSRMAQELGLGDFIRMGRGEALSGGRKKSSILGNGLEAMIGAIFLDGGFGAAERVVLALFAARLDGVDPEQHGRDWKSMLQERLQGQGLPLPQYSVEAVSGPDHERTFSLRCDVAGAQPGYGLGRSKRAAEQAAARQVFEQLNATDQEGDGDDNA